MATRRKLSLRTLFSDYCEVVAHSQPSTCPACGAPAAHSEYGDICLRGHISDDQGTPPIGRTVDLAAAIVPAVWREAGQAIGAQEAEKEVAFLRWMAERAQADIAEIQAWMPLLRRDIELLIDERDTAVEDNAVLLTALRDIDYSRDELPERVQRLLDRISEAEHPGQALMGELTRRLSAAQGVVDVARAALGAPLAA